MNRLSEYMGGCDNERINGRMEKGISSNLEKFLTLILYKSCNFIPRRFIPD